jgi:tRNA dimethylallyltransferase
MEIGTGADVPRQFTRTLPTNANQFTYPFFEGKNIRLHGIGIIQPEDEWSLAHFCQFARNIFEQSEADKTLSVVVGGTGLYQQKLFSGTQEVYVQPDPSVRQKSQDLSLEELQTWLQRVNPKKYQLMNDSDRNNPRRLVRSIELSQQGIKNVHAQAEPADIAGVKTMQIEYDHFTIGFIDSLPNITDKISQRIEERLKNGMIEEVTTLLSHYTQEQWKLPAFSATGYKEVSSYIQEKISYDEMKELWLRREVQYAKRQLTWWKKYGQVEWIDISEPDWKERAQQKTHKWLFSLSQLL